MWSALMSAAFLLLPLVALVLHVSWGGIVHAWLGDGRAAVATSVESTLLSMGIILLCGTPLGFMLSRRRTPFWRFVEFLMLIPLLMPPLVMGLLLVFCYGPYSGIGAQLSKLGLTVTNSLLAVVLAQVYEAMPYYVFSAQAAFSQVDEGLERASLALGVGPFATFRRVTLPLALPGLCVGFAMAFARAIGAFGAVIVMAYYPVTLPVSVWIALQEQGLPAALPLAVLLLVAALPVPLLAVLWRRSRDAASVL
jgi:molybdate/tungstate transport system permease protein